MNAYGSRRAFTLVEILLVVGIIGILAMVTITAINPSKHISSAKDSKHDANTRTLHRAVTEYIIDEWELPAGSIPIGKRNAIPICIYGIIDSSCINLDMLVPNYVADIPSDEEVLNPMHTGYTIYRDGTGQMRVTVPFN